MAGNAHRSRHGNKADCIYCQDRPKYGNYNNHTGHRRNLSRKKRQRKRKLDIETLMK